MGFRFIVKYHPIFPFYPGLVTDAQTLSEAPQNVAGNKGSNVTLNCGWNDRGAGAIIWWNHVEGNGFQISSDGSLSTGVDASKYRIANPATDQFNLQILSLAEADVGDYACYTLLSNPALGYGAHVLRVGKYFINVVICYVVVNHYYY